MSLLSISSLSFYFIICPYHMIWLENIHEVEVSFCGIFFKNLLSQTLQAKTMAVALCSRAGHSLLSLCRIRKARPTCANQGVWALVTFCGQRRILFTQSRGTLEHERQPIICFRRLYFPLYIFPPHLSVFGHRAILIWGDLDMALGGCSSWKKHAFSTKSQ